MDVIDAQPSVSLPSFCDIADPNFSWGNIHDSASIQKSIESVYEKVVHWRANLFKVPSGNSGKALVMELSKLYEAFGVGSAMECIALKAACIMPSLLLQRIPAIILKRRRIVPILKLV